MPAGKPVGVTTVQPVAADAGTVSPSSPAVIPASVHHRKKTCVMKIRSLECDEHAPLSHCRVVRFWLIMDNVVPVAGRQ